MSVRVGVSVRECSNVCRVQHRHGETRPRARGSCVLLLLSTAHHQTPAGGLGPRRPPSSTRRCAELQSAVRGISGRPRSRRAWSHLLAPARRFQPRMLMLRWMGFVVVVTKHFVEEQRQETRGWRAVGGGVTPPRCLVQPACAVTPLADVTSRPFDTIHTAVRVRLAPGSRKRFPGGREGASGGCATGASRRRGAWQRRQLHAPHALHHAGWHVHAKSARLVGMSPYRAWERRVDAHGGPQGHGGQALPQPTARWPNTGRVIYN